VPRLVGPHGPRRRSLPPAVADDRRTIGFLISDVARMMRSSFDRRVRRIGLTRPQWLVLSLLHRRPGISQTELAEMLEVERAVAGRMIDRLERRRWVVRRADPEDRRVKRLFLTAEARGVQAEMGRIAEEMLDDAMALLGDGEREALTEMLERVKARLQAMAPPRPAGTDAAPDPAGAAAVP
jgi:DNA-binding MarR family transcriptional regulator